MGDIPCSKASSACPHWNQQALDSGHDSEQLCQLSRSILSITNSSEWLFLVNRCKYSISQLNSFCSLEHRLRNRSLLWCWAKSDKPKAWWLPRRELCCAWATASQPPRNINYQNITVQTGALWSPYPPPPPASRSNSLHGCVLSWSWLAALRIKLGAFMHISPPECWTPKPLFSPWSLPRISQNPS